jgi:hypothetical protein
MMKHRVFYAIAFIGAILFLGGCSVWEPSTTDRPEATPSFDVLDEYGWWVELPGFGIAWQPDVDPSWRPYEYGHWLWTDQGWYWAGYEPFAWIVYHYGYWYHDLRDGWFWLEGDEWSPSRVQWILGEDYVSWAPMPPPKATLIEPWQEGGSSLWAYVPYSGFLKENPGRTPRGRNTPPRDSLRVPRVTRRGPEVKTIEVATDRKLPERRLAFRDVQTGGRTMVRTDLPVEDESRVKAHATEIGLVVHKRAAVDTNVDGAPRSPTRQETARPMVPIIQSEPVPQQSRPQHRAAEQKDEVPKQQPEQKKSEVSQPPQKVKVEPSPPSPKQPAVQKKDEPKEEKPKEASTKPDR